MRSIHFTAARGHEFYPRGDTGFKGALRSGAILLIVIHWTHHVDCEQDLGVKP